MDVYTQEEFIRAIKLRGMISRKSVLADYLARHPKQVYTEDDLMDYYYETEKNPVRHSVHGLASDGQNLFSASNMRNSGPDPLWEINRNYRIADMADERFRQKKFRQKASGGDD